MTSFKLHFIFVAVYVIVASLGEMKTLEETVNNAFSKVIGLFSNLTCKHY